MPKYNKYFSDPYLSHMKLVTIVGNSKRVLDVGCATGYLAEGLVKQGCQVIGIKKDSESIKVAKNYCHDVISADLDNLEEIPYPERHFDVILFADILEHLKDSKRILTILKKYLADDGYIVLSVPNVANIRIRVKLLFGVFNYEKYGIMDESHLMFFTKNSLFDMIQSAGFKIIEYDVTPGIPYKIQNIFRLSNKFCYKLAKRFDTLLSFQFILKISKL